MTRLRPVPARDVVRVLRTFGFAPVSQRGSHLKLRSSDGTVTIVVPVHAAKDVKVGLLRRLLREADIEPDAFLERL